MRSCLQLNHDVPEMLVAAVVNVQPTAISPVDVPVHLSLLEGSDCSCPT